MKIQRLIDNSGSLGAIISTLGCASCFPAAASFGTTLGLGFLAAYEGIFINTLLPVFAVIALLIHIYSGWINRNLIMLILGISGPLMILATLYLFWTDNWSTYMLYAGLMLMAMVSILQWVKPTWANQYRTRTA